MDVADILNLEPQEEVIAKGKSTEQRQSYDTGHGDFCFGRLFDRTTREIEMYGSEREMGTSIRENNILPVGKRGGQRRVEVDFTRDPVTTG